MPRFSEQKREMIEEAIRQKAFEATNEILSTEGWSSFTMEKLAARIGVAKGTIYNYFRDKHDVVYFIQERMAERGAEEVKQMMEEDPDSYRVLKNLIPRWIEDIKSMGFLHVTIWEMLVTLKPGEKERFLGRDPLAKLQEAVKKLLQRGMDQGVFRRGQVDLMAVMIISVLSGLDLAMQFRADWDITSPAVIDEISQEILQSVGHGGNERV